MSLVNNIAKTIAFASVIAFATMCANAEQIKVSIPTQTNWGTTTLSPGDYLVTTESGTSFMHLTGNGKSIYVLVAGVSVSDHAPDAIELVNSNGTPRVHTLSSAQSGKTYTFLVPKNVSRTVAFQVKKESAH